MRRAFERMFSCVGSFFAMATTANRSEIRRAYLVSGDWKHLNREMVF